MRNVQSNSGTMAVFGVMILAAGMLAIAGDRFGGESDRHFEISCHTPGLISARCVDTFTHTPRCVQEDCSDVWPRSGFWTDLESGSTYYRLPDTPMIVAEQS